MKASIVFAVVMVFAAGLSLTAVLATGRFGSEPSEEPGIILIQGPEASADDSSLDDATWSAEVPRMIDITLAAVEIGPQADHCGSEATDEEALKSVVMDYVASNQSHMETKQVGEDDRLVVMACVYPNDFYPGQAVLSVTVPLRLTEPILIPVSDDCIKRVNDAIAKDQPMPADCGPGDPPVDPETLLIPVSLEEVTR
ncbi:MAG: hypothetical protein IH957_03990 [Chloroflexi bacterium]|nr:hypothetical protein [Chloroflexota bacterium]